MRSDYAKCVVVGRSEIYLIFLLAVDRSWLSIRQASWTRFPIDHSKIQNECKFFIEIKRPLHHLRSIRKCEIFSLLVRNPSAASAISMDSQFSQSDIRAIISAPCLFGVVTFVLFAVATPNKYGDLLFESHVTSRRLREWAITSGTLFCGNGHITRWRPNWNVRALVNTCSRLLRGAYREKWRRQNGVASAPSAILAGDG